MNSPIKSWGKPTHLSSTLILLLAGGLGFFMPNKHLHAQSPWQFEAQLGVNIRMHQSLKAWPKKYPGIKVFVSGFLGKDINNNMMINYGASLGIYNKTLGNDLYPLRNDWQIDLLNAFTFGLGTEKKAFDKYMRTVHNTPAYTMRHNFKHAAFLSANFVLNKDKRNQAIGAISFTFDNVSVNYYNDGGYIIDFLPIADNFDRWWTGGLGVFVHGRREGFNRLELNYDQFTGYAPLIYNLTSALGTNIPRYDYNPEEYTSSTYNTSEYSIRVFPNRAYHIDLGINGALSSTDGNGKSTYFGLQDILHILLNIPLHPNREESKLVLGFGNNYSFHQQTLD